MESDSYTYVTVVKQWRKPNNTISFSCRKGTSCKGVIFVCCNCENEQGIELIYKDNDVKSMKSSSREGPRSVT